MRSKPKQHCYTSPVHLLIMRVGWVSRDLTFIILVKIGIRCRRIQLTLHCLCTVLLATWHQISSFWSITVMWRTFSCSKRKQRKGIAISGANHSWPFHGCYICSSRTTDGRCQDSHAGQCQPIHRLHRCLFANRTNGRSSRLVERWGHDTALFKSFGKQLS